MRPLIPVLLISLSLLTSCGTKSPDTANNYGTENTTSESTTTPDGSDLNAVYQAISEELASLGDDVYAKDFSKIEGNLASAEALALKIQDVNTQKSVVEQLDSIRTLMKNLQDVATKCTTDQMAAPQAGDTIATITTTKGVIKARIFTCDVPEIAKNFVTHANNNFYDGIIFHRVIKDFMIQTGDPLGTGMGGYSYQGEGTKLNDEFSPNLRNVRGALSMANSGPNTNGSQFFIVQAEEGTPWLDLKHSVFGQVYEGMDVVDAIANAETDDADKPAEEIQMTSVEISTL